MGLLGLSECIMGASQPSVSPVSPDIRVLLESGDMQPLDTLVEVEVSEVKPSGDGFSLIPGVL